MNDLNRAIERQIGSAYFEPPAAVSTSPVAYGVNNQTCYADCNGHRYVFRVYMNKRDSELIRYELDVLSELQKQPLSFQIPAVVPNLRGEPVTLTDNGRWGVLFHYIEGERPGSGDAYEVGRATGELSKALARLNVGRTGPYRGSYHLYEIHPHATRERLHSFLSGPPEGADVRMAEALLHELDAMERKRLQWAELPHQLVHGDLLFSNWLVNNGRISGVLDFEFVSPDLRAMELAIGLTQLIDDGALQEEHAERLIAGYSSETELTDEEIRAMPDLLKLRYMGSFIHHFGRYMAGVGTLEGVQRRLRALGRLEEGMAQTSRKLSGLCYRYFHKR
ncbi:phosphotransferase [Paenibacillus doosanensis]|uniref:Homoserine kinase n=1 Tax=Paenibacillus konkukensis TaxID=2020716 RepID=A0ABY4RFX2_9BACL|nr:MULTISPECIES: phosphotransferase [Paenibacillus]MCS7464005.1 phosphotransferase [Paenibacillus doosanensis]UQZ81399.1 Homoserine kinase [Paenibacillus konkukensis]